MSSWLGAWRLKFGSMAILTRLMLAWMLFCFTVFISPYTFSGRLNNAQELSQYNCANYSDVSKLNTRRDAPSNQANTKCKSTHCSITAFSDIKSPYIDRYYKLSYSAEVIVPSADVEHSHKLNLISAPRGPPKAKMLG